MTCIFLDRDGVINKAIIKFGKPHAPKKFEDFQIIDGIKESLLFFKKNGFKVCVFTNQPDVKFNPSIKKEIIKMHNFLIENFAIDLIEVCYHDDSDGCECRKPKPGMLINAAKKLNVKLDKSFVVGDRWRDIQAGQMVNCRCFYINNNYNEKKPEMPYIEIRHLNELVGKFKKKVINQIIN